MGCNDTYTRTAPKWDIEEAMIWKKRSKYRVDGNPRYKENSTSRYVNEAPLKRPSVANKALLSFNTH